MHFGDVQQSRSVFIHLVSLWLCVVKISANTFAVLKNQQKAKCYFDVWMKNLTYQVTNPAYANPLWDKYEFDCCRFWKTDCSDRNNWFPCDDYCHRQSSVSIYCDFNLLKYIDRGFYFRAVGYNSINDSLEQVFPYIDYSKSSCLCSSLKHLLPTDDLKYELFTDGTAIVEINNTLDTIDKSLLRFSVSLYSGDDLLQSGLELEKVDKFTSSVTLDGLKRCQIYKIRFAFEYGRCIVDQTERVFTDKEFIFD